jgi:chitin disaccharide deacetylase
MRLIVNGDDFGASRGVNRGIMEAHTRGVLTSTSLMVEAPASEEATSLVSGHPNLGVGLHVVLDPAAEAAPGPAVERQLERFMKLMGKLPTHIDSHHNVHNDRRLLPAFSAVAEHHRLPLRGHCGVRRISSFYGRWDGETHLEQITPSALARILPAEAAEGVSELCCHPGYADEELVSSYFAERETELQTLCEPAVAELLRERGIRLTTFHEVRPR